MSNTIYIFGDSFSVGYGLNPFQTVTPKRYKKYFQYAWHMRLNEFFNSDEYQIENHGMPGASNDVIKDKFLLSFPSFKKGDKIIVGITNFVRVGFLLDIDYHKGPQYLSITGATYLSYLHNLTLDNPVPNFIPENIKNHCTRYNISPKAFKGIMEYVDNWLFPMRFEDQNYKMIKKIYLGLVDYFKKLDIDLYLWDSTIWGFGENITSWSKDAYKDSHWSPNGNSFFLNFLLWGIENDHRYLDEELLRKHKQEIDAFAKKTKLDVYIPHDVLDDMRTIY